MTDPNTRPGVGDNAGALAFGARGLQTGLGDRKVEIGAAAPGQAPTRRKWRFRTLNRPAGDAAAAEARTWYTGT